MYFPSNHYTAQKEGLAGYGHMTMFSIGSLVGQVLCTVYNVQYVQIGETAMVRDGVGR